jgi:ectoine hydroxylase-related dioxygenase (phytanoyl-CoA dioxygenase family)
MPVEAVEAVPRKVFCAQAIDGRAVPVAPSSGVGSQISPEQQAAFRRNGYLLLEKVSTPEELASLRVVYDRLFSDHRGWDSGDLFDMVGRDNPGDGLALPQLLWPSKYEPSLRETRLHANAEFIARQLLGPGARNILEHAINKPPLNGAATPWHQDDAFNRPGSGFVEQISIWMPLQDVTIQSGCLLYIRGSNHDQLYPHRSPRNDPRIHGLETVQPPDLTHCVAVEMRAGDAVIHHSRTLHSAGVNTSREPRRAYVLGYSVQTRPHSRFKRDYPWNLEKQTARAHRELQSLPPLKRLIRRIRRLARGQRF